MTTPQSYVDMAYLKTSNIVAGRIKYSRKKTDEPYNIKIHDQLNPLISYFTGGKEKTDYLLNVVKSENSVESYNQMLSHKRISSMQAYLANLRKSKMDGYQDEIFGQLSEIKLILILEKIQKLGNNP